MDCQNYSLMWLFYGGAGAGESQMERRIPERQGAKSKLLSWSWMGWKGTIDPDSWHGGDDYLKMILHGRSSVRTSPLVQWYVHGKEKGFKRQIRSIWSKYRDHCYSDHGTEIPVGWERYDYHPDVQELYLAKQNPEYYRIQKYFFKHISDNCTEFWYPITISQAATVPETLSHLPFISCHTSRCWLAGEAKFQKWTCQWDLWVPLRDGAGDWAGILNLHYINPASDPSFPPPTQYELIAISAGYASSRSTKINGKLSRMWDLEIPESRHAGFPCTKRYEFINVLWIEWEDGIAYRKGVGRVEKHMWEAQSLEWIDVTLG